MKTHFTELSDSQCQLMGKILNDPGKRKQSVWTNINALFSVIYPWDPMAQPEPRL